MTTPVLQTTEALSPEAEASTALIAGNKGPEPHPEGFVNSRAVSLHRLGSQCGDQGFSRRRKAPHSGDQIRYWGPFGM